ncbi:hypothetical protein [Acuticoccus sp.]|uniref:hypothetical protein n=1 Tax=Acuticoccus sp. TaxID=1904378 RepID=UPI003B5302D9
MTVNRGQQELAMLDIPRTHPYTLINRLASYHATIALRNDAIFGENRSWGGFLEWIKYNLSSQKWVFPKDAMYHILMAIPLEKNVFTIVSNQSIFCYRAGTKNTSGNVLCSYGGDRPASIWEINDILYGDKKRPARGSDWLFWRPEEVNLLIFPYGAEKKGEIFLIPLDEDVREMLFDFTRMVLQSFFRIVLWIIGVGWQPALGVFRTGHVEICRKQTFMLRGTQLEMGAGAEDRALEW